MLSEGTDHGNAHNLPLRWEMRRLEALGKREGLTVEQMVCLGINDLIGQRDAFHAAAKRVMEKNAELYRRLS